MTEKRQQFLERLHKSKRAPYGTWKCEFCGVIAVSKRELYLHRISVHNDLKSRRGGPGALKGLTKDTSPIALKISNTLKRKYKTGELVSQFAGKHLSIKHREAISRGRAKTLDKNLKCGRRADVKWYRVMNLLGQEYIVRGHWEEHVAQKLNELGILWTRNRRIPYKRDIVRNYVPDFYLPELDAYLEVKGYFSQEDREKLELVCAQHPNLVLFFIGEKQYKDFLAGKLALNKCRFG